MKLTKKNLIEFINKLHVNLDSLLLEYGFLFNEIENNFTTPLQYNEADESSDYNGMITYYSPKLNKSIVLDWDFQNNLHTPESFANQYLAYIEEVDNLENSFNLIIPC